ncbi:MAG: radical SAM protein [Kiritimatiellae bacterium]|nr:radical SAM protein [Kiritimatiellia bacterium]
MSTNSKPRTQPSTVCNPPPYRVFEAGEDSFVYDTTSCRFIRIDPPTLRFLELCQSHSVDDAKGVMLGQGEFPESTVKSVASEVRALARNGLFKRPDYSVSSDRLEKELRHRYDATPWNKLELALAETCNLACTYCYCGTCRDILPNQGLMSETVARQAINWLFAVSGKSEQVSITFFGGEPLLNKPVFMFAVEYSQKLGKLHGKKVFYSMTTNGTLLDDDVITVIKRYNFGLMVSLDGPPEIHNAQCPTRGGEGSFDAAATGIRRLMARRRAVTVRCTMAHPVPRMLDLVRYFEEFGFTRIVLGRVVNPVHKSPVDFTDDDFASCERQANEEIVPWMLDKLAHGERPKYYPYSYFVEEQEKSVKTTARKVSPFKCGACRGTTTVGADGMLYPCHRFVGMEAWRIGTIGNGPDYGRCKKFWRDYRACVAVKCESCWLWAQCKGPCPWEIAQADGSFKFSDRHCEQMEKHIKKAVAFYTRLKAEERKVRMGSK